MKSLILAFLGLLSVLAALQAAPFLVADPVAINANTALNAATFTLTFTGTTVPATNPVTFNATINSANSTIQLVYDLAPLGNGLYNLTAYATNVQGESSQPTPNFTFSLGVPPAPTNIKIVPVHP
jgi:hypothetical protein